MKKLLYLILLGITLAITSCNKEIEFTPLAMPTAEDEVVETFEPFNVTTNNPTYKIGEPVRFYFTGNTESIDFYSGEKYHDYEYKDGRVDDYFNPILTWSTYNDNNPREVNNFHLMVSTDLIPTGGTLEAPVPVLSDIQTATWTDLSSKMIYPAIGSKVYVPQENNLSAYTQEGKPLYIAYKYVVSYSQTTPSVFLAYAWYVRGFLLVNKLPDKTVTLGTYGNSMFTFVNENPIYPATWNNTGADRSSVLGNKNAPAGTSSWLVTKAFYPSLIEIGGDRPIPIKSLGASKLLSYSQVYSKPGTYKAHFVVKQKNVEGIVHDVLKSVNLIITE